MKRCMPEVKSKSASNVRLPQSFAMAALMFRASVEHPTPGLAGTKVKTSCVDRNKGGVSWRAVRQRATASSSSFCRNGQQRYSRMQRCIKSITTCRSSDDPHATTCIPGASQRILSTSGFSSGASPSAKIIYGAEVTSIRVACASDGISANLQTLEFCRCALVSTNNDAAQKCSTMCWHIFQVLVV